MGEIWESLFMVRNTVYISLFSLVLSLKLYAGPIVNIKNQDDLDNYIKTTDFNGVVLVKRQDKILYEKAFGYRNFETKEELKLTDKFQIGSLTKQFISASLLQLVEEGKIKLEDSVAEFLPDLNLDKTITLRQILSHTAGIANYTDQKIFWKNLDYEKKNSLDDLLSFIKTLNPDFLPGTKWNYSNSGYIIAGKLLEVLSGKSYSDYISKQFLSPLGMNDSGVEDHFEKISDVLGYEVSEVDGKVTTEAVTGLNLTWALSAGDMYSTVYDLAKWVDIYHRNPFLSDASIIEMQNPILNDYGLGIFSSKYLGETMISHDGHTIGFGSSLVHLKESKLTVVSLNNNDGDRAGVSGLALLYFKTGNAFGFKQKELSIDQKKLSEYVGQYSNGKMIVEVYLKNNALKIFVKGQREFNSKYVDEDSFNIENFAGEEFLRDENQNISGLRHYQNGQTFDYKKLAE
jgi:CubicO group peptidase (beta-lactamase class C family)